MIAFKFLARGGISPFQGARWPRGGAWIGAPREADEDTWVRACLPAQLAFWLGEELWRVELADPVREGPYQLASPRGRLVAPIEAWDRAAASDLAGACAWRARDLLLPHLLSDDASELEEARDFASLQAAARRVAPIVKGAGYVASAARHAQAGRAAGATLNAAMLAAALRASDPEGAFDAERAWQGQWLAQRIAPGG